MTTWYNTGTITLNTSGASEVYGGVTYTGAKTVIGSSTLWTTDLVSPGEGIRMPNGIVYEIAAVNAAAQKLYLVEAYPTSVSTAQPYAILPLQGYLKSLANRAAELVGNYGAAIDSSLAGKFSDGTLSAPGISFTSDTNSGIYHSGTANEVVGVADGAAKLTWNTSGVTVGAAATDTLKVQAGTALLPSIVPNGDANTGVWFPAADTVAISTAGVERLRVSSTGAISAGGNVTLGDATSDTVTVNGYMGVGGAGATSTGLYVQSGALTGTNQSGVTSYIEGNASASAEINAFWSWPRTADAVNVAAVSGLRLRSATKGAGSTITNLHGVIVEDQTQGVNNYGITLGVNSAANKWNVYANGTAANYFAGNVGIGTNAPTARLDVRRLDSGVSGPVIEIGDNISGTSGRYGGIGYSSSAPYPMQLWGGTLSFLTGSAAYGSTTERLRLAIAETVFNDPGNDYDFRVESDTNTHALFVDAGNSLVGINNSAPTVALDVTGSIKASGSITENTYAVVSQTDIGTAPNQLPLNQYLGALAYMDAIESKILPGAGITQGTGTVCTGYYTSAAGLKTVRIIVDLTGLKGGGTAGDLIGSDSTATNATKQPCYIGQLPTGMTVLGGKMLCLETPAGGGTDIDLYSAVEGTGVQDSAVGDLTETQLINAGAQALGTLTYIAADPTGSSYLYFVSQGTSTTAYTAGRFLIELFGV